MLIAPVVNAQQNYKNYIDGGDFIKDPECNINHTPQNKTNKTCKCDIWSLYLQDTSTVVWENYTPNDSVSYAYNVKKETTNIWKDILLDGKNTIYYIQLPEIECINISLLRRSSNHVTPNKSTEVPLRRKILYNEGLFTGTTCERDRKWEQNEDITVIEGPRTYVNGNLEGVVWGMHLNGELAYVYIFDKGIAKEWHIFDQNGRIYWIYCEDYY